MSYEALYQRLLAEAETWPLSSHLAFKKQVLHLGRKGMRSLDPETQALADGLEQHLRPRASGLSLDSLERLRDATWFGEKSPVAEPEKVSLAAYICNLAARHLDSASGEIRLRTSGESISPDHLVHWRWLSLFIPADLLVAAQSLSSGNLSSDYVSLQSEDLKVALTEPVAETHLHATAAFGFPLLWTAWSVWFSGPNFPSLKLNPSHDIPFGSERMFAKMLGAAFLARVLMGQFLTTQKLGEISFDAFQLTPLEEFFATSSIGLAGSHQLANQCRRIIDELGSPSSEIPNLDDESSAPSANESENLTTPPRPEEIQSVYRELVMSASPNQRRTQKEVVEADPKHRTQKEVVEADPLASLVPSGLTCLPETWFASSALRYLLNEGLNDTSFAKAFWQYQRIRCFSFRFLTEEAGTAGLDWFQRHFSRLTTLRVPLAHALYDAVLEATQRGLSTRSVELRLAPKKSRNAFRDEFRQVLTASLAWSIADNKRPEIGVVYHFLKERSPRNNPALLHADPGSDNNSCRFEQWYKDRRSEAGALLDALQRTPDTLMVIRGLDVASSELAIPTWATVNLIRNLRSESIRILRKHGRWRAYGQLRPLRVTYHAGEEYQRLTEGLRRIHELIEYRVLRSHDRIGHGLALGARVNDWVREAPITFQSIEERLDDLLWELERYLANDIIPPPDRRPLIESLILKFGREIYGEDTTIEALLKARRARHDPGILTSLGYPDKVSSEKPGDLSTRLLHDYLTSREVYRRGQQLTSVRAGEHGERLFLQRVQRWLTSRLSRLNITVEINPTSNLLIANLQGLKKHPVIRLSQDSPSLRFSVNSDDPLTFATSLADEYAYLHGELFRRAPEGALWWISLLRESGWRSKFTLQESALKANLQLLVENLSSASPTSTSQ